MGLTLFATLFAQVVLLVLATWAIVWLIIAIPRLRGRQTLVGTLRTAWETALPFGILLAIIVVGRQLLESSFQ